MVLREYTIISPCECEFHVKVICAHAICCCDMLPAIVRVLLINWYDHEDVDPINRTNATLTIVTKISCEMKYVVWP